MKVKILFLATILSVSTFAQTAQLVAKFRFENNLASEQDASLFGTAQCQPSGIEPDFEWNTERGSTVLHQFFGYSDAGTMGWVKFPNPLRNSALTAATVSLWVNWLDTEDHLLDTMWAFLDEDNSDDVNGRWYLTSNLFLSYNGNGGWWDCNHPDVRHTNALPYGIWKMVTITVNNTGFKIYVDGQKRYDTDSQDAWSSSTGSTAADTDYSHVIALLNSAPDFYLGKGSWWGSAELLIDDLLFYNGALSDAEIANLYGTTSSIHEFQAKKIYGIYDKNSSSIRINGLQGNEQIELYNLAGQVVLSTVGQSVIPFEKAQSLYLLKIKDSNGYVSMEKLFIR
ncbi:MAG: hypothetical protein LBH32_11900 [Dysgonamonadaceae bacterium]|jgi:arabinan endo-1,5-alpha-L-arabinosidase|nr:hypothetical protein [Dysgonamonadaceae bacterium]